jgi:hypothetical protein
MKRRIVLALGFFGLLIASARPAAAATPQEVQAAIDRGVATLYKMQGPEGNWESAQTPMQPRTGVDIRSGQWGGDTALAVYALLAAGEDPDNPRLVAPINLLKNNSIVGTYALGMRCQSWPLLNRTSDIRARCQKDCDALIRMMKMEPEIRGLYDYTFPGTAGRIDHSCSNVGVLGVWACSQILEEMPDTYWLTVDAAWRKSQNADGGWGYGLRDPSTISMTAAGIATLYITDDRLNVGGAACNGNLRDPNIERAMQYITANLQSRIGEVEPNGAKHDLYALYNVERIGAASGRKYLGTLDWYKFGVDYLLANTDPKSGGWQGENNGYEGTSLALLFLIHGRAPVAFNKLDYSPLPPEEPADVPWDERPRDVAKLSRWISKDVELDRPLNWQIVTLAPPVEELHDAPILVIEGNKALHFTPAEEQKLREFCLQGGMIVFNADCGALQFTSSVRKLAAKLFPVPGEFRELPGDHPMYRNEQYRLASDKLKPPRVLGVTNGVRELMLLIPDADPSKAWQMDAVRSKSTMFELGADILQYAVDKQNLRYKGETYIVTPDNTIQPTQTIKLARLEWNGLWDPEPYGWTRLAAILHNEQKIDLAYNVVKLGSGGLKDFKIAHLTGTTRLKLNDAAKDEIRQFINGGGTLIVDAAGGSTDFAESARKELGDLFPDAAAQLDSPLKADHAIYSDAGPELGKVLYRSFARRAMNADQINSPHIRGLQVGNRTAIFFSGEDLSGGLVGQEVDGINGYTPAAATTLMQRMILYAATPGGGPQTRPATEAATTRP